LEKQRQIKMKKKEAEVAIQPELVDEGSAKLHD
jgi:hypothetical protein